MNVLLKGALELPAMMTFQGSHHRGLYLTADTHGVGSKKMKSRRNILRGVHKRAAGRT